MGRATATHITAIMAEDRPASGIDKDRQKL